MHPEITSINKASCPMHLLPPIKRFLYILTLLLLFLISLPSLSPAASLDAIKEVALVIPEQRLKDVVTQLMPYKLDMGKGFSGSFQVKSVKNIQLGRNTITFRTHIYGKNIVYLTKIGKQTLQVELGSVNSHNQWTVTFRYDRKSGTLLVKPRVEGSKKREELERGDFLLDSLLLGLGGIEYPAKINKIKPFLIKTLFDTLQINIDVSDMYIDSGKLVIEVVPAVIKK